MGVESEEFATEPVPVDRQVGWIRVALISAMVAFSLPTFITGVELFVVTTNESAVSAILLGSALLAFIGAISGSIGARSHLSSYMLARIAFGTSGAALVNLAFALSLLGWFGVNIDLFSGALLRLLQDTLNVTVSPWLVDLFAGVVMTVTTIYGFRAIDRLSMLLVPVMMVVTVLLIGTALETRSITEMFSGQKLSTLSFGGAVSSVVGGVIVGAVILPDITRFIRHWQGAIYTAIASYLIVGSIVMTAGGLAADTLQNSDFLDVMIVMGLGWGAFAIIIAGSWVLNTLNLYSTTLSIDATFPGLENRLSVIVMGLIGTGAAFLNILDHFLTFLFYLAIVFVPVAGVTAVDYVFVRRSAYHEELRSAERRLSPMALAAWGVGALIALLGAEAIIQLSGIAALDAMLASAIVYAILSRFDRPVTTAAATDGAGTP